MVERNTWKTGIKKGNKFKEFTIRFDPKLDHVVFLMIIHRKSKSRVSSRFKLISVVKHQLPLLNPRVPKGLKK